METRIKYEGYILNQQKQVEKLKKMENVRLPEEVDYAIIAWTHKRGQGEAEQSETHLFGSSLHLRDYAGRS